MSLNRSLSLGLLSSLLLAACNSTAPGSSAPISAQAVVCGVWTAGSSYLAGDTVTKDAQAYRANWWTQGNDPATSSGPLGSGQPWTTVSSCSINPPPPPPPAALLKTGTSYSFQVLTPGLTTRYLRHSGSLGYTEIVTSSSTDLLKLDATWKTVAGLADPSCFSFESANIAGNYLRHQGSRLRIDPLNASDALYKNDATFCARAALDSSTDGVSLEAKNIAGSYVRHRSGEVWLDPSAGATTGYKQDASWKAVAPFALGTTPPPPGLNYASAPYVLPGESTPDLTQVMAATGQKTFMLAFILAPGGGGCTPTWDGTRTLEADTIMQPLIDTVRRGGGDVNVSVGGYGGTKLGQVCPDAASTAAAYQKVIDKYKLRAMDFDLEEPEYENLAAINNEIGAVAILQRNNPGLSTSFTVPGTQSGTGYFGQNVLNTAKALGVTNTNFSIMPFDGGFNGAASQTAALEVFHTLLMNTFGWDSATAYQHEGVSLMNGRTDTAEHFYPADFQTVLDYAHAKGLGRFTFWSVGRDRACAGNADILSASCSGVAQSDWAFTKITAKF